MKKPVLDALEKFVKHRCKGCVIDSIITEKNGYETIRIQSNRKIDYIEVVSPIRYFLHKCGFIFDKHQKEISYDYAFITCMQTACQPVCKGDLVTYKSLYKGSIKVIVSGYDYGAFLIGTVSDKKYGRHPYPAEVRKYNLNPNENYYFINFWQKLKYKPLE